jgi:hypothetical protein
MRDTPVGDDQLLGGLVPADALPWHRLECISERVGCRIPRSVMINNQTENILRIVALIRKNRLFLGRCEEAGPRFAIGLSVLRSCHLAGLYPLNYLAQETPTLLEYRRRSETGEPLPDLTGLLPLALARPGQRRRLGVSSIATVV